MFVFLARMKKYIRIMRFIQGVLQEERIVEGECSEPRRVDYHSIGFEHVCFIV
jgi:hypothetical protein